MISSLFGLRGAAHPFRHPTAVEALGANSLLAASKLSSAVRLTVNGLKRVLWSR